MTERKSTPQMIRDGLSKIKYSIIGTRVYALVGKSGTGKSFRAKLVAENDRIEYIVDDGLLIKGNQILAGKSAKQAINYVGAIRTALFDDQDHRREVCEVIERERPKRILLIGTSKKMVQKMSVRLDLPEITRYIMIEDVASQEEIERAINYRKEGKHVIPVPAIEVEQDYSKIFIDSIKILFKKSFGKKKESRVYEKSVVRPDFDKEEHGRVTISEAALSQMVLHCIDEFDSHLDVTKIRVRNHRGSYYLKIYIDALLNENMNNDMHALRKYIEDRIQRYTGIILEEVSLSIGGISSRKKESP